MFLHDLAREQLPRLAAAALLLASLSADAVAANQKLWKLAPKLHMCVHLCEWQALVFGNPRFYCTYPYEDLAGMMSKVGETCHPRNVVASGIFNYMQISVARE